MSRKNRGECFSVRYFHFWGQILWLSKERIATKSDPKNENGTQKNSRLVFFCLIFFNLDIWAIPFVFLLKENCK